MPSTLWDDLEIHSKEDSPVFTGLLIVKEAKPKKQS